MHAVHNKTAKPNNSAWNDNGSIMICKIFCTGTPILKFFGAAGFGSLRGFVPRAMGCARPVPDVADWPLTLSDLVVDDVADVHDAYMWRRCHVVECAHNTTMLHGTRHTKQHMCLQPVKL